MKPSYALEVKDISKTHASVKAVEGLSFEVKPGEIFGSAPKRDPGKEQPGHGDLAGFSTPLSYAGRQVGGVGRAHLCPIYRPP